MSQTNLVTEVVQSELLAIQLVHLPPREAPSRPGSIREQDSDHLGFAQIAPVNEISIPDISKWRTAAIIGSVAVATLLNSLIAGLLVVGLPTMARDLSLESNLLLWPSSVASLSCGCTLMLSGSISDVIGGRNVYLLGCFLLSVTTVACGLSRDGIELILFRALQGIALSLCLPSAVQVITRNIPIGPRRNIAFACLGAAQPVGFSIGLVIGGFFVQGIGWRYGWHISAILMFVVFVASIFGMPKDPLQNSPFTLTRLRTEIDWIGCLIISTSLGCYSYVLSVIAGGASHILEPASLTLLVLATILLPTFPIYIRYQEHRNRVVIIPSSLWSNMHFTSLCLVIFLVWSVFQAVQSFLTLYFQNILQLAPIPTSLQFLPMVFTGAISNVICGSLVAHVSANNLVLYSAMVSALSPLIMALVDTKSSYWLSSFWAIALIPISADVLFTISNLIITQAFPDEMHGVAGGVFNTLSQIGASIGLGITAVIAGSVTTGKDTNVEPARDALMDGYRAAFWACFAVSLTALVVAGVGMRKVGKVGLKRE